MNLAIVSYQRVAGHGTPNLHCSSRFLRSVLHAAKIKCMMHLLRHGIHHRSETQAKKTGKNPKKQGKA